jgi:Protein of unknown function (DUF2846)
MKSIFLRANVILAVALLIQCGTSPSNVESTKAASFSPQAGKSFLYVYRPAKLLGAAVPAPLAVNKRHKGEIANGKFIMLELPAGRHQILAGNNMVVLPMKEKTCYYIKQEVGATQTASMMSAGLNYPILAFHYIAHQMPESMAKIELSRCKQTASTDGPISQIQIIGE